MFNLIWMNIGFSFQKRFHVQYPLSFDSLLKFRVCEFLHTFFETLFKNFKVVSLFSYQGSCFVLSNSVLSLSESACTVYHTVLLLSTTFFNFLNFFVFQNFYSFEIVYSLDSIHFRQLSDCNTLFSICQPLFKNFFIFKK